MPNNRLPISVQTSLFYDSQQVESEDLTELQNSQTQTTVALINNHIGSGILSSNLIAPILFDSDLVVGYIDGKSISPQAQPSDNNFGNQLSLSLTNSLASGSKQVKVIVIGLDFNSNLQYETFIFKTNETLISRKHFAKILVLLFNDLNGDPKVSFNLGGRLVISEAAPLTLSSSPIMVSQVEQPNLPFANFFLDPSTGFTSLQNMLIAALPLYDITRLNIQTQQLQAFTLAANDVTSQIGEKFLATTNNIQKITVLLSVQNTTLGQSTNLNWTGDLILSIYPLQSTVNCDSDITPNLPIDFSPSNIPLAQISFNYTSLMAAGIVLSSIPQPVDFIFSNSAVANGNTIDIGSYLCFALKRSGSNNACDILVSGGGDLTANARVTSFTGSLWVDLTDQDLWFQVWTDSATITDGAAYDQGVGSQITKTILDPTTQSTIDYVFPATSFTGNDVYSLVYQSANVESVPVPDQRTGNPVFSRQQNEPSIELLNTIDITNLENASEPLVLGTISDKNIKSFNPSDSQINSTLYSAAFAFDELLIKVVDDPTDAKRFDTSVSGLMTNLLNGDLVGAKIIPDATNPSTFYRIADAHLDSMILGDVNGDGIVDESDLDLLNNYLGYNLNVGLQAHTTIVSDGYTTTFSNGYQTLTQPFANLSTIQFQLVDPATNLVAADGYDGYIVVDPSSPSTAVFTSSTVLFNEIIGLSSYNLVIFNSTVNEADWGGFNIVSLDVEANALTISKTFLTGDNLAQMFRADIDGDFVISNADGYLLNAYIERQVNPTIPTASTLYPGPTSDPYLKIGSRFNVIRLRVELFVDRNDDYTSNPATRAVSVHPVQDIFLGDGYLAGHDFFHFPLPIAIDKELTWDKSLISVSSQGRLVPTIFSSENGLIVNNCSIEGVQSSVYPVPQDFDPGVVDVFAPNNLIIGTGELKRPDGDFYKVDFEVGTIVLEIPDGFFGAEKTIDIMNDFIVDYTGNGTTRLGFPSLRFADCSFVTSEALTNDQLRFSVAVQSFSPNTNGLSSDGYYGAIVDGKMGVNIDYTTGLLTLNFTNLYEDAVLTTLSTKVQVNVFLKKGGFNNAPLFVGSSKVQNMLSLVSGFGGGLNLAEVSPPIGIFSSFQMIGGSQSWILVDGNGQQTELANKYKIRTTSATPVNAFAPVALKDDSLTAIEVTVLAKNKNGPDSAKWKLHATYNRYNASAPHLLSGGSSDSAPDTFGNGSAWGASIGIIGNTWLVQIAGDTTTIDWTIDVNSKELL
jgi:hypothetical protein